MTHHAKSPQKNRQQAGFTLLEMAVVMVIIALVLGMSLGSSISIISNAKMAATNNRIRAIETALMAYRLANNRLPCPADRTLAKSSAYWGWQASTPGDCYSTGTIKANFATNISHTYTNSTVTVTNGVVEGVIPVRSLGLPDEFMYDGWATKIGYAVTAAMTNNNAFLTYGNAGNCGFITVKNTTISNTANRTTAADYAVISYGSSGHGGYNAKSGPINAGVANADMLANCHCDGSGNDTGYTATYVQEDPQYAVKTTNFDDVVRFKERFQMHTTYDEFSPGGNLSCPIALPGFRVDGTNVNDKLGFSVAVGDINGDGIPDLIIGAPGVNSNTGAVYVLFGSLTGFADPLSVSSLNGTNGFIINGITGFDQFGYSVAVGDFNGDGVADLVVGALGTNSNTGSVFVIFGGTIGNGVWPASFSASALNGYTGVNGTSGIRINGINVGDQVSSGNVAVGDINGDGYADILIGSPTINAAVGGVYVIYGYKNAAWPAGTPTRTLDNGAHGLMDTNGNYGFVINGDATHTNVGDNVVAGDINGDGVADILIGANENSGAGVTYVLYGHRSIWTPTFTLSAIDGHNGFTINGVNNNDFTLVNSVADVTGDGIGDIMLSSMNYNGSGIGRVYVVPGQTAPFPKQVKLSDSIVTAIANPSNTQLQGAVTNLTALAAGDFNGDGYADIAFLAINGGSSSVYTLFGNTSWTSADKYELDNATGSAYAGNGQRLCFGDVNGDGRLDLVYGDVNASPGGNSRAGSVYVIYGQRKALPWMSPYNLNGL